LLSGRQACLEIQDKQPHYGSAVLTPEKVLIGSRMDRYICSAWQKGINCGDFNAGTPISSSPAINREDFIF
jgi:hypothetical protein